jgi:hypothetical protein
MFWECDELEACENYPGGSIPGTEPAREKGEFRNDRQLVTTFDQQSKIDNFGSIYKFWKDIIWQYSECKLTRPDDKLIALAGVAQSIQRLLEDDEYIAGLWRNDMLRQLLWQIYPDAEGSRVISYRAPTWSWACLDKSINTEWMDTPILRPLANIVHASSSWITTPFGQLNNAVLRISGPIVTLQLRGMDYVEVNNNSFHAHLKMSQSLVTQSLCFDCIDDPVENLHYLPLYHMKTLDSYLVSSEVGYFGLVLRPTGTAAGQFYRCGTLWLLEDMIPPEFNPPWEIQERDEWFEYESMNGKGNYTVSIV